MKDGFKIVIDSFHLPGLGTQENVSLKCSIILIVFFSLFSNLMDYGKIFVLILLCNGCNYNVMPHTA